MLPRRRDGGETRTVEDTLNGDVSGVPVHPKRIVGLWRIGSELADPGVEIALMMIPKIGEPTDVWDGMPRVHGDCHEWS